MHRISSLLITSTVLVGLVSCTQAAPPEISSSSPQTAVTPAVSATKPASEGFGALTDVVSKTKTAVTAGNFEQGKTEFAKFEDSWKTIEDGVKAKSGGTYYGAIEKGMDKVNTGLKAKDAAATLASLKTLSDSLVAAAKP